MRYMPRIGDTIAIKKSLVFEGRSFAKGEMGSVTAICSTPTRLIKKPPVYFRADRDHGRQWYYVRWEWSRPQIIFWDILLNHPLHFGNRVVY